MRSASTIRCRVFKLRSDRRLRVARGAMALLALSVLAGCGLTTPPPSGAPQPVRELPTDFRHAALLKPAAERVAVARNWWSLYGDDALNALQQRLPDGNQNLAASMAQVRIAQAAIDTSRAALLPSAGAGLVATRSDSGTTTMGPSLSVNWELDLFG